MRKHFFYLLFLSIFNIQFSIFNSSAQIGTPFIHNYTPKDYFSDEYPSSPQNFSIVQDDRGVIYVGNASGVLEYDGVKWRMVMGTKNIIATSLAKDTNGIVYMGGEGNFGYFSVDTIGKLYFVSLLNLLKEDDKNFGRIWRTHTNKEGVYFLSTKKIFRFHDGKIKIWNAKTSFYPSFMVNGKYFVYQKDIGLTELKNDSFQVVSDGEKLKDARVMSMMPINNGKENILGTTKNGLFLQTENSIFPVQTTIDSLFLTNSIKDGASLNNTGILLSTYGGGAVNLDNNLNFKSIINKTIGLQDEVVLANSIDRQNELWLGLNTGISRVEINSSLTLFNDSRGVKGIVMSIIRNEGILYAATSSGIYYSTEKQEGKNISISKFNPVEGINAQSWFMCQFNNTLFATTNIGTYQVIGKKAILINSQNAISIIRALYDSTRIFIGMNNGFKSLVNKNHQWIEDFSLDSIYGEIKKIIETENHQVWLEAEGKGVARIDFTNGYNKSAKVDRYFIESGLPNVSSIYPTLINGKLIFSSSRGIYHFNESNNKFVPDSLLGTYFAGGINGAEYILQDSTSNIWIANGDKFGVLKKEKDNNYYWDSTVSLRIPKTSFFSIWADNDGVIWFGSADGLIRYDTKVNKDYNIDFPALIRKITLENDSVIFWGSYWDQNKTISLLQPEELKYKIDYSLNSLTFEYAAPSFDNESANQFSYFLEGQDKDWSAWSGETKKQYTNLSEGKYIFHLKAKNVYNHIGKEGTYEFTILPPWYRTSLAFGGYGIFFIAFVYGAVRLNSRRLEEANKRLQEKIRLATVEIVQQKDEIAKKNKDITSSIKYAKRIQDSSLPIIDNLKLLLPESFILFRPRDIVSGDFYWFGKTNPTPTLPEGEGGNLTPNPSPKERRETALHTIVEDSSSSPSGRSGGVSSSSSASGGPGGVVIIAAVDCTGHGVPGAFMSLIGNNIMNDIILKSCITHPTDILKKMNDGVSAALKKDVQDSDAVDGMDIALCSIDLEKKMIEFAGAGRSLVMVRRKKMEDGRGEMEEGKGKEPISNIQLPVSNTQLQTTNNELPTTNYELTEIKGNKVPIGLILKKEIIYKTHPVPIQPGDTIYIFTDGFCDQFGADGQNKFQMNRFEKMLLSVQDKSMDEQKELISSTFDDWRGEHPQVDDVLVIGVRF